MIKKQISNQEIKEIKKIPQIIGIINPEVMENISLQSELNLCDRLEIRYDLFSTLFVQDIQKTIYNLTELTTQIESIFPQKSFIATIRLTSDGGLFELENEPQRIAILSALLTQFRSIYWVDIEVEHPQTALALHELCHREDILMLRSHHNFKNSYTLLELETRLQSLIQEGVQYLKLALSPQSLDDELDIYQFILRDHPQVVSAFGMGQIGRRSRVLSPLLGAPLTYAYVGLKPAAPGQWQVQKLKEKLDSAPAQKDLDSLLEWLNED